MPSLDQAFAEYGTDPDRYQTKFFALCTRKAEERLRRACPNDYNDLAQQVAIELWRAISKFNPAKGSFATFFNLILRSVRNDFLAETYREAAVIDPNAEVDFNGDVNDDDWADDDFTPVRINPTQGVFEHGHNAIDLEQLKLLQDVDPRLISLLASGHTLSECQRTLETTRARIRTQVSHIKKALIASQHRSRL